MNNPLTAEQQKKIAGIRANTQAQVMSARRSPGMSAAEREQKIDQLRRQGHQQVMDVLTPAQQKEFESWWNGRGDPGMGMGGGMRKTDPGMGAGQGKAVKAGDPSGKSLFQTHCVVCHGEDGNQIAGWRDKVKKMSTAAIEDRVKKGGGGMPAFAKTLSAAQIKQVAGYAKQLASE